jgi:tetratricopeptide (TPR) repeat protein
VIYSGRDGLTAAIALLREAVRLDPGFAEAHAALAAVLGRRMDLYSLAPDSAEAGIAAARRALELDDRLAAGYRSLSENLWYAGRYQDAGAAARRAIALDPNDAASMELLFWAEYYFDRHDEALSWALRGFRLNPRLVALPNAICVVYLAAGDHAEAERWCDRAISLDPQDTWPQFHRIRLDLVRGRVDDARRRAEAMRQRDPAGVPARLAMGDAAAHSGDWRLAAEHHRQAYALAPDSDHYEPTRLLLAHALTRVGDDAGVADLRHDARREVEALSAARPEHRGWRWRLGLIHALEGDHAGAIRWLEASSGGWTSARRSSDGGCRRSRRSVRVGVRVPRPWPPSLAPVVWSVGERRVGALHRLRWPQRGARSQHECDIHEDDDPMHAHIPTLSEWRTRSATRETDFTTTGRTGVANL